MLSLLLFLSVHFFQNNINIVFAVYYVHLSADKDFSSQWIQA